ncbi:hypothetical protein [Haloimpatiens massiliensis]|uniref:hypothetical protein n=1 Tax=Haloimpatiens massiliensis TaxID=1658110 RepID=UPI000C83642D|nr:hypothetical protein [Haloimpatiens massiliensis]
MDINMFKNKNELDGVNMETVKEKIKEQLIIDSNIKKDLEMKKTSYKDSMVNDLKNFLTKELNFIVTENNDVLTFEFESNEKVYRIEYLENNRSVFITHNFIGKSETSINLYIDFNNFQLNKLDWSLEENNSFYNDNAEQTIKCRYVEQDSIAWYKKEYNSVKSLVEENIQTMDNLKNKEIKDLFIVVADEKEYSNIIDLIKSIIENN